MTEKNPFTVLGFAQCAFKGLSDESIRSLVKAQFLALVTLHHPDRHGDVERFKEVQEAFDKLKEDFEFGYWKKSFLRNRKDQVAELEKAHHQTSAEVTALRSSLIEFLIARCRGKEIFQHPTFGLKEALVDTIGMGGFSIFNPPPVSAIMMDRLTELLRKQALEERRKAKAKTSVYGEISSGCFEFCISPEGVMTRQDLVKTYFDPRENWRPKVHKEWIELRDAPPTRSYYWKPEGKPVVVQGTLIGSFPTKVLSDNRVQENPEVAGLIPTDVTPDDYKILERGYSAYEFEPYLRYILPRVMSGSLVIVAEGDDERSLRFKILGYARKILAPR